MLFRSQEQNLVQYVSAESRKRVGQLNKERMTGKKLSEETKRRMREASHHQRQSEDGRRRISEAMKNRIVSDETKEKLRNANIGSKSPVAVLNEEKVKEIKIKLKEGIKQSELAKQFNVGSVVVHAELNQPADCVDQRVAVLVVAAVLAVACCTVVAADVVVAVAAVRLVFQ